MPHTPYPPSYYAASTNPAPPHLELQGEVKTDVCMIDAGYTDLSTILFLSENGFKITVLEATRVGSGTSGRSGGQIVNSYSRDIDVIEHTVGRREVQLLGEMALEGERIIRERMACYGIQYDLKDGGVSTTSTEKQMGHLHVQKRLWERCGHNQLEVIDVKRIREMAATDNYIGDVFDMSGGHTQPSNFALGEMTAVEPFGNRIHE